MEIVQVQWVLARGLAEVWGFVMGMTGLAQQVEARWLMVVLAAVPAVAWVAEWAEVWGEELVFIRATHRGGVFRLRFRL